MMDAVSIAVLAADRLNVECKEMKRLVGILRKVIVETHVRGDCRKTSLSLRS